MKTTLDILKLDCQSCAMMIEGICEDTVGVKKAEVNARTRQLVVTHELPDTAPLQQALTAAGYPVQLPSDQHSTN